MIRRKLVYLLIVAVTAFIGIMYTESSIPAMVFAFELAVPVLLILYLIIISPNASFQLNCGQSIVVSKNRIQCFVFIKNNSIFPIPYMEVTVDFYHQLEKKRIRRQVFLKVPAKDQIKAKIIIQSQYCGVLKASVSHCRIYDPIRLLCFRKRGISKSEYIVMPTAERMNLDSGREHRTFESKEEKYDAYQKGDDPSEVLELRSYQRGDRPSQIHWKMSARLNELMIKERAMPIDYPIGIYLDRRSTSIQQLDAILTLLYSLSYTLMEQDCPHIIWTQDISGKFNANNIIIEEDLSALMETLLQITVETDELTEACRDRESDFQEFYRIFYLSAQIKPEELIEIMEWKKAGRQTIFALDYTKEQISELKRNFEGKVEPIQSENLSGQLAERYFE